MTSTGDLTLQSGSSRRVTAVDLVRDTLRTAILRGDLTGDTRLIQTDIASQLGVSTTPVREAMRDLVTEGLIVMESHKIGKVRKPDWHEMAEIVRVRKALESTAVELAMANINQSDLDEANALANSLAAEEDLGSWVQVNVQFHSVFHRATSTVRLVKILGSLEEASGVFVAQAQILQPAIRARAMSDHFALLDAYRERDPALAVEIQHRHLDLPLEAGPPELEG